MTDKMAQSWPCEPWLTSAKTQFGHISDPGIAMFSTEGQTPHPERLAPVTCLGKHIFGLEMAQSAYWTSDGL